MSKTRMSTIVDFTDPNSLLIKVNPNDTEQVHYVYKPLFDDCTIFQDLIATYELNEVIPLDISSKALIDFIKVRTNVFGDCINNLSPYEQIEIVQTFIYFGIKLKSGGHRNFEPIADQILESYEFKGLYFQDFKDLATQEGMNLYNPVDLICILTKMMPRILGKGKL